MAFAIPPPGFAYRLRGLRQECPIQCAHALDQQVNKDRHQRYQDERGSCDGERSRQMIEFAVPAQFLGSRFRGRIRH